MRKYSLSGITGSALFLCCAFFSAMREIGCALPVASQQQRLRLPNLQLVARSKGAEQPRRGSRGSGSPTPAAQALTERRSFRLSGRAVENYRGYLRQLAT